MKICFIGKYPPIQGGVSMHGYWTARGLARRGHSIFVVTNANEVEPAFRIHLTKADRSPDGDYAKDFGGDGFVKVSSTEPADHRSLFYIPQNNPAATRLATIATDLIRAEQCDLIFTYYLEPYGLAAHLASSWTGVPYVLKHAGSDLHRLALRSDLQTAYVEVMHRANRIITSGPSRSKILSYGIPADRLVADTPFELPDDYFRPDGPTLDTSALLEEFRSSGQVEARNSRNFAPLDRSLPVLGVYSKLGEFKGTFDLLHAMARLVRDGFPFHLVMMSNAWHTPHVVDMIERLGIAEYVRFMPFLPHWRVPEFIRSCTAVAFLERDFPITVHTPTIPSEAIACGKCLVVSEEVARKQRYRVAMRNFKNIVIVPDPKDHDILSQRLRFALEDRERAERIGRRAFRELGTRQNHQGYISGVEALFMQVASEAPTTKVSATTPGVTNASEKVLKLLNCWFPITLALLTDVQRGRVCERLAPENFGDSEGMPSGLGNALLSFLNLEGGETGSTVFETFRYENTLYEWGKNEPSTAKPSPLEVVFSADKIKHFYPYIQGDLQVVEFACDVEAIAGAIKNGGNLPRTAGAVRILFHSGVAPMCINDETEQLLELLADGSRTCGDILQVLWDRHLVRGENDRRQVTDSFLSVLEALYWVGILGFRVSPTEGKDTSALENRDSTAEPESTSLVNI